MERVRIRNPPKAGRAKYSLVAPCCPARCCPVAVQARTIRWLRNQFPRVHDAERVERLLDRSERVNSAGRREAGEFGALQLADAVLGGDRTAGGGDEIVN